MKITKTKYTLSKVPSTSNVVIFIVEVFKEHKFMLLLIFIRNFKYLLRKQIK